MTEYVIRRLAVAILTTVAVAAVVFAVLHQLSPSPVYAALKSNARPEAVAAWNLRHGYDRPEAMQFASYLWGVARLRFGYSYAFGESVGALLRENVGRTAYLSAAGLVLSLVIVVALGVARALRRDSVNSHGAPSPSLILACVPPFLLGVILIQVFALDWHVLPARVPESITTTWGAITHPRQLTLPIVTLVLVDVVALRRYLPSSALDDLAQDAIQRARAQGLPRRSALVRHLLRNAPLTLIAIVGLSIPTLVTGSLLIEVLFRYHGLGLLFYNALDDQDYAVLCACTMLGGIVTVAGKLIADVAIAAADPRVRPT